MEETNGTDPFSDDEVGVDKDRDDAESQTDRRLGRFIYASCKSAGESNQQGQKTQQFTYVGVRLEYTKHSQTIPRWLCSDN